jgi:hypothetical protein
MPLLILSRRGGPRRAPLDRERAGYLYLDPAWKPTPPLAPTTGTFTFVDLLRYAGAA